MQEFAGWPTDDHIVSTHPSNAQFAYNIHNGDAFYCGLECSIASDCRSDAPVCLNGTCIPQGASTAAADGDVFTNICMANTASIFGLPVRDVDVFDTCHREGGDSCSESQCIDPENIACHFACEDPPSWQIPPGNFSLDGTSAVNMFLWLVENYTVGAWLLNVLAVWLHH